MCSQHLLLCNGFGYITVVEISLLSKFTVFFVEEKGELLTEKARYGGENDMIEEKIFKEILESKDGNYVVQAQILASMKPEGW